MNISIATIPGLVLAFGWAQSHAAELPKSGRLDVTSCWSGDAHVINSSPNHTALGFTIMGTSRSNPPGALLDMTTFECVGVGSIIENEYSRTGFCNYIDNDGDKALGKFTAVGPKGTYQVLSGTGKYQGMTVNATFDVIGKFPAAYPGSLVGCNRALGTYQLP